MMFFSIILICLCFSCYSCEFVISGLTEMTYMERMRTSDLSGVIQTNSVVECAIECANYLSCKSLSYHSTKGLCLLYPFLFSMNTTGVIGEDDWKSYMSCRGCCPAECGYVYNQTLDWCYRLVEGNMMNATQAADFCRIDGARMIRINSQERQLHITDLLLSRGIRSVWIGGHSADSDNNFVYEDGTILSYFNWNLNNPDGNTYIRIRARNNYEWEDVIGDGNRDFMCERCCV